MTVLKQKREIQIQTAYVYRNRVLSTRDSGKDSFPSACLSFPLLENQVSICRYINVTTL